LPSGDYADHPGVRTLGEDQFGPVNKPDADLLARLRHLQGNLQGSEAAAGHIPYGEIQILVTFFQIEPLIEGKLDAGFERHRIRLQSQLYLFGLAVDSPTLTVQSDRGDPEDDL
jgi:hypothetical protein